MVRRRRVRITTTPNDNRKSRATMRPVPNETKTRRRPKYNGSAKRPPEVSVVNSSGCKRNCRRDAQHDMLLPQGESSTEASDDYRDDGYVFCIHNVLYVRSRLTTPSSATAEAGALAAWWGKGGGRKQPA